MNYAQGMTATTLDLGKRWQDRDGDAAERALLDFVQRAAEVLEPGWPARASSSEPRHDRWNEDDFRMERRSYELIAQGRGLRVIRESQQREETLWPTDLHERVLVEALGLAEGSSVVIERRRVVLALVTQSDVLELRVSGERSAVVTSMFGEAFGKAA